MSKIGKMPISIANGVRVTVQGQSVQVIGAKGNTSYNVPTGVSVAVEDGKIVVSAKHQYDRKLRALFGMTRALLANMVKGAALGFEKKLELAGVGYRAQMQGNDLVLSVGFSHPVKFSPKPGITFSVADNVIIISGQDKMLVGQMAAVIRAIRPPEPYKGKGIKYKGEHVRRKEGKAAKAAGAK